MKINVGEYELVHSGTVIGIKDNPITIKLPDPIEGDFVFIINFVQDPENKETVTKYTAIDNNTVQIDFKNFNGCMGTGNSNLIPIGSLKGRSLFWNYRVFDLVKVSKAFMFNFYVGKEVENGK